MEKMIHSSLGGSSCHRWWACPGSVALIATLPKQEMSYPAAEGTAAHRVAECILLDIKKGKKVDPYNYVGYSETVEDFEIEITEEMVDAVIVYIDSIKRELKSFGTGASFLSVETPFTLSIDKEAYGTNDTYLYKPFDCLHLWDYKHGKGVVVEVENNKQLMYYALGAIEGKDVEKVVTYIVQPRAYHPDGPVRKCVYTIEQLRDFESELRNRITLTRHPSAGLHAGKHCKFCPAIGDCPAVRAEAQMVAKQDFAKVNTLSIDNLTKLVKLAPRIIDFLKEANLNLTKMAKRGELIKGFKLVKAKSNRIWKSEATVLRDFKKKYGTELYTSKIKTPAQMEKISNETNEFLKYIEKPDKGLTLVSEEDPRLAVKASAADDFKTV